MIQGYPMNRSAVALLLAALPLATSACGDARSDAPSTDVRAQSTAPGNSEAAGTLQPIALRVPGMSCAQCARPIEKNLEAMGVHDVEADLATKWVTGRFDPERLTPEAIRAKVEDLRFLVTEVRVD